MGEPKLPSPPDDLLEEDDDGYADDDSSDNNDDPNDDAGKASWKSWIRIGVIGVVLLLLFITVFSWCGRSRAPVQPPQGLVADSTTQVVSQPAQPAVQQAPTSTPTPVTSQTHPAPPQQSEISVPQGGSVILFNCIVKNGMIQKGESTIALVVNGQVSQIQVHDEMYEVSNPQVTKQGDRIVAISWMGTNYALNEAVAKELGLTDGTSCGNSSNEVRVKDVYEVQSGDTASDIRKRFGMKPGELKSLNRSRDLNWIKPGDKLNITRPK